MKIVIRSVIQQLKKENKMLDVSAYISDSKTYMKNIKTQTE